jgi:hypothetical protein
LTENGEGKLVVFHFQGDILSEPVRMKQDFLDGGEVLVYTILESKQKEWSHGAYRPICIWSGQKMESVWDFVQRTAKIEMLYRGRSRQARILGSFAAHTSKTPSRLTIRGIFEAFSSRCCQTELDIAPRQ